MSFYCKVSNEKRDSGVIILFFLWLIWILGHKTHWLNMSSEWWISTLNGQKSKKINWLFLGSRNQTEDGFSVWRPWDRLFKEHQKYFYHWALSREKKKLLPFGKTHFRRPAVTNFSDLLRFWPGIQKSKNSVVL